LHTLKINAPNRIASSFRDNVLDIAMKSRADIRIAG
jgi:hypothetical protein